MIVAALAASSRLTCTLGDHNSCEATDGAGACCAEVTVTNKVSGNTENVGDVFARCYDFDAVLDAFDANGTLVDSTSAGGNGNTYNLVCSDPLPTGNARYFGASLVAILVIGFSCLV